MIIVWHFRDLRLEDNPALDAAAKTGMPVIPLFIYDERDFGSAAKVWLHHSLEELKKAYAKEGVELVVRRGKAMAVLEAMCKEHPVQAIYWNERFEPGCRARDSAVAQKFSTETFLGNHLVHPEALLKADGKPYVVFSPFYKAFCAEAAIARPCGVPKIVPGPKLPSDALNLLPHIHWDAPMMQTWTPGRAGAEKRLEAFCEEKAAQYKVQRDFVDTDGTSRLSPHLAFGEISPREVWHKTAHCEPCRRQLVWREFATLFLYHFPHTVTKSWREEFERYPWKHNPEALRRWQKGETGYPIVDAAMRELWETGWMHNRARMIVGSFLIKDLMIHWVEGARWFWDTLVDADLANNTLGWQWVSGSGPDAAPYFRIFNPILQSQKFDPQGAYIRKYIPELKDVETKWIHAPWEEFQGKAPQAPDYPKPIVDHKEAREKALLAYEKIKKS